MAYRNKVYIAFDGDNDMTAYKSLEMWNANPNFDFNFNNAHDLNHALDSSKEETIKRKLRERFSNSKLFILLVGEHTKNLYKFIRWEIEVAIELELPIIAVNLNGQRKDDDLMPAVLKNELHITVPYKEKIIKYAMDNWPASDKKYRNDNKTGGYFYTDSVYKDLDL